MNVNIGLKESSRTRVLALLESTLADETVLAAKTRGFHWNVTGFHFSAMHEFFGKQYEALDEAGDEVAERSRALGGRSLGSMKEMLAKARLTEAPARMLKEDSMVGALLSDHEALARSLRRDVDECGQLGDQGTADFLTGMLEMHEKMAWMLRAFVS